MNHFWKGNKSKNTFFGSNFTQNVFDGENGFINWCFFFLHFLKVTDFWVKFDAKNGFLDSIPFQKCIQ